MSGNVVIKRIDAFVFRYPNERPVATSFGIMRDRPAVFVRLEAADGAFGWGEIFANWPAAGAEHRANLLMHDIADLVLGVALKAPRELFEKLESETRIRAIQCGEMGPFRQVIAGLDMAMWDLFARREGVPVANLLVQKPEPTMPIYASGIKIDNADAEIEAAREAGFAAFKVKVGFNRGIDAAAVAALSQTLRANERLFTDANQAWDLKAALGFVRDLDGCPVGWLEEPLPVDAPVEDWKALAAASQIPLAGGENIAGRKDFTEAISAGLLKVIQPDLAKWGGFTACFDVARQAIGAGRFYCPHFLGGGIGLIASAHLLSASHGSGLLEVDVNTNPLRDAFPVVMRALRNGRWTMSDKPGLGVDDLPGEISQFQTLTISRKN